jgi:type II secretory pathway component GspD/PulD (secretin)
LIPLVPAQNRWTVFYLQAADCSDAAMMLEQLFPSSSVSTATTANSGSMFGGITGGVTQFANTLGNMSGLNQLGVGGDTLKIIPEPRSNALFVSGPSSKVRDVEMMLKVLDETELPGTVRDRVPRMIPVRYADVNEVANNIRQLYGDLMQQSGNRNQINPLALLMNANQGGRSNGRGGRSGNS